MDSSGDVTASSPLPGHLHKKTSVENAAAVNVWTVPLAVTSPLAGTVHRRRGTPGQLLRPALMAELSSDVTAQPSPQGQLQGSPEPCRGSTELLGAEFST